MPEAASTLVSQHLHLNTSESQRYGSLHMMSRYTLGHTSSVFTQSPSPVLKGYTDIVDSLDAIQKTWDENETNKTLRSQNTSTNSETAFPRTSIDSEPGIFENLCSKYTRSRASDSSSSGYTVNTPRTEEGEEEEEDELVVKIVANLQAKIRAVKKRKRLAAEVVDLRRELITKEIELKECDRVMALEMGQVAPGQGDNTTNTSGQEA